MQILVAQYGGRVFRTEPLSLEQIGVSIALGASTLIVSVIGKLLVPKACCKWAVSKKKVNLVREGREV